MKRVFEEKINGFTIAIVATKDGFEGLVQGSGKKGDVLKGTSIDVLKAALRNEAGKMHPNYFGISGAKKRFLEFFPDGFSDQSYLRRERSYKDKAKNALLTALPIEIAAHPDSEQATAARKALITNLLSPFESARMHEVLGSSDGPQFVKGAAQFASGNYSSGLKAMERAVLPHGRMSWPIATYLPYFWAPEGHLFIKPVATVDFATRINHQFAASYSAEFDAAVYESALDLMMHTSQAIIDLGPKDGIDVQSFIWVVGSYTDNDHD